MKNNTYIIRFAIVGTVGFIFNSSVLLVLTSYLGLSKVPSEIIAMLLALQLTFALHDQWTYTNAQRASGSEYALSLARRYRAYLVSNSFGSVLTIVLFGVLSRSLPRLDALAIAAVISMVWNFAMNKLLIWRKPATEIAEASD